MTKTNTGRARVALAAAGAALLLTVSAFAQSTDADFAAALGRVSAQAAQSAAVQRRTAAVSVPEMLAARVEPDLSFTPGHLCSASDPNFDGYRYPEQIAHCRRNVTEQMKATIAAHYGIARSDWGNYEFDHLIPLAIGGDSSIDNLWPQPHGNPDGSQGKDRLEDQLYHEMVAGSVTQAAAVQQIFAWFNPAAAASGGALAAR
ncbi:MAG: hypothetical protein HKL90_04610 [Elusimicrobia bacterium]|nr:hypothetical protein [Elusimicrobiota bacterium]